MPSRTHGETGRVTAGGANAIQASIRSHLQVGAKHAAWARDRRTMPNLRPGWCYAAGSANARCSATGWRFHRLCAVISGVSIPRLNTADVRHAQSMLEHIFKTIQKYYHAGRVTILLNGPISF